ncbi:hypothetical protein F5B20DRAFT_369689 [Whalleya microplaca]|nr:hypothetical protein F5B20DRAFT_369689 [Whalleya microplaca]
MLPVKTIAIALSTFALAGTSNGWLLQFWEENSCSNTHGDTERGGEIAQTNKCMSIMPGMTTMIVKEWDSNCNVMLWGEDGDCYLDKPHKKPFFNMTLSEARSKNAALFDETTDRACFRNKIKKSLGYASYVCKKGGSGGGDNEKRRAVHVTF